MGELLKQGQDQQEVVNGALALQVSRPLSQPFGQLFGAALEGEDALIHGLNLGKHIYPQQVAVAFDGGYHV